MDVGLTFANATAKAKELGLFGEERLRRMVEATTLSEAVKVLVEVNYGGGAVGKDDNDFETILGAESALVESYIKTTAPAGIGFELFGLKHDYHNLKALVKSSYSGIDPESMLEEGGQIEISALKEALASDTFTLNEYMANALIDLGYRTEERPSPRRIDTVIDGAMFKEIKDRVSQKGVAPEVKEYFCLNSDGINLAQYARCVKLGLNSKFFADGYVEGGSYTLEELIGAFDNVEKLRELLKNGVFAPYVDMLISGDVTEFETARDNIMLDVFRVRKNDMFSVAPVMGYYLGKLNEIKGLRIVLVCVKNGVEKDEIEKRLRKLYA